MTSEGLDALEELIQGLIEEADPTGELSDMTKGLVEARIAHEHPHLALLEAFGHEHRWCDAQKLELIERFTLAGMEAQATTLCHRWKLTRRFAKKHHDLFRTLFPKLPPHPNDTDKEDP